MAPLAAEAQQAAKIARIGYLSLNRGAAPHLREAFLHGLRDLGYVEGRNVVIEYRDAEGKLERLPALAAELVALKVDVILAPSTVAALAAKQATRTLPIVFAAAGDPVGSGLVTSLARPGGNVTGLSPLASELVGKRLELLTQAVPGVSRVAVLRLPGVFGERTDRNMLKEAEAAARGCRLYVLETGVSQPAALALYARAGYVPGGPFGDYAADPLSVFMTKRSTGQDCQNRPVCLRDRARPGP